MASERMLDDLLALWNMAEARSRKYTRGSTTALLVTPEAKAEMDRIAAVMDYAESGQTDRAVAAKYPDVVKRALRSRPSAWAKIAPEVTA